MMYILWAIIVVLCLLKVQNKLTYIEFQTMNSVDNTSVALSNAGDVLVQDFEMPYDILHGISIKIGTFDRDNNSQWDFIIRDKENQRVVYRDEFNASILTDYEYHMFKLDKDIKLERGKVYEIQIVAKSVSDVTSLHFFKSEASSEETLFINGEAIDGKLCFNVYGGDYDIWWTGFTILCALFVLLVLIRANTFIIQGKSILEDRLFLTSVLAFITFLLLCTFSVAEFHLDENDNIRGGMIIANGGVLYRDYITQHTPVTYYLCAVFALFGAGSVQQFRLSYYLLEAIVWGLLYYRHSPVLGKKQLFILPILKITLLSTLVFPQANQILSDGVQGICMVALLLEFLEYYQDRKLDLSRCLIVSTCIWGSFGAAFVSVYALIWVVAAVLIIEYMDWRKRTFSIKEFCQRYYKLFVAVLTPLICAVIYFGTNHALQEAVQQAYKFNLEVYPQYTGGFGSNMIEPFINAMQNYFSMIVNIKGIFSGALSNELFIGVVVLGCVTGIVAVLLNRKQYLVALTLFAVMACSATRGYGFHGLAAWYVSILIISLYMDELMKHLPKGGSILTGVAVAFLLSTYCNQIGDNLLYEQPSVSTLESHVVELTEEGEDIFIDAYCCDSIYLLYRNRYPMNKAIYMLPWYMDWYEQTAIEDLNGAEPRIVVYNEDQSLREFSYFANVFLAELKENYSRFSNNPEDGWEYKVWIRAN